MFSALVSFLGGNAFRMIWGEIASWLQKRQDHEHELELLRLQSDLDVSRDARQRAMIQLQAELGVKEVEVKLDADLSRAEMDAWQQAVRDVGRQTGIRFLDIWNGAIRPLLATLAIVVVVAEVARNGFVLSEWDRELIAAILGIYVADRALLKRGK